METTITGIVYLDMIQQFLIPQLDEDDQEEHNNFQQDGSSPHCLGEVREHLSARFSGRWIAWRPRSPDLTPLDLVLWRFVKKIECSYQLRLQMSLSSELELLPQLQKWRQRCYVACGKELATNGRHIEP
jgi:hypothetical protein